MLMAFAVYFRTLKSGCRIEERLFETLPRMLAGTAIYMIVAWRTLFGCRLGRSCPDVNGDVIFDASEWQSGRSRLAGKHFRSARRNCP